MCDGHTRRQQAAGALHFLGRLLIFVGGPAVADFYWGGWWTLRLDRCLEYRSSSHEILAAVRGRTALLPIIDSPWSALSRDTGHGNRKGEAHHRVDDHMPTGSIAMASGAPKV